jgi:hypothetical protein
MLLDESVFKNLDDRSVNHAKIAEKARLSCEYHTVAEHSEDYDLL